MAKNKPSRSEAKRTQLLKIATEMFLASGYEDVSVDAIVARAGGTKTNVYKLFGAKSELFAAVVKELCESTPQSYEGINLEAIDPADALRQIGRLYLTALLTRHSVRQYRMIIGESERFPNASKRWFKASPERARDTIAAYFEKIKIADRSNRAVSRRLAGMFLDMLGGEQLFRQLLSGATPPTSRELNRVVEDAVEVFLHGALSAKKK
ncbi:TetR/AcrR family transcriptional regulator [Nevskia soli]|uniref:TetR/AcrR family transcriptional regulator n=1 Tax=Nevskia soli TaxID=418856 RepID=UPI000691465E|nr:TetR/AcrR family transcriptional regulator [Nevskia soli]